MCNYRLENYSCPHPSLPDSSYCIFHLENGDKDSNLFEHKLKELLFQEGVDGYQLNGFVFPEKFNRVFFRERTFEKSIDFSSCKFTKYVNFSKTKFKDCVYFQDSQFLEGALFIKTEFADYVYFTGARFSDDTDFYDAEFREGVDFDSVRFDRKVSFADTRFLRNVELYRAQVNEINFGGTLFSSYINLTDTEFKGSAYFRDTHFNDRAIFANARFLKNVYFIGTKFQYAKFSAALFLGTCLFEHATVDGLVDLSEVVTESAEKMVFRSMKLDRISFLKTDVTKFSFEGVSWSVLKERYLGFFKLQRRGIFDESRLKIDATEDMTLAPKKYKRPFFRNRNPRELSQLALLEVLYRQLKNNYERNGNYGEAGDFHIGEMETRRKQLTWRDKDFYPINLYRIFSYYGENWLLALSWLLLLVIGLPSFLYMYLFGLEYSRDNALILYTFKPSLNILRWITDALAVIFYSLKVSLLQRPQEIVPANTAGIILSGFQSIAGPALIALFLLALRRRFKR